MKENASLANVIVYGVITFYVFCAVAIFIGEKDKGVTYVGREKHVVTSVKRHIPRSVQEEMNLYYDVTIDDTTTFKTLKNYSVGDTVYYEIYKINK